jgi:hypothetical protein
MSLGPVAADRVRKLCGYALATAITVLTFRVFSRFAKGTQRLDDPEIWVGLALVALAIVWVKAARRVRASQATREQEARKG